MTRVLHAFVTMRLARLVVTAACLSCAHFTTAQQPPFGVATEAAQMGGRGVDVDVYRPQGFESIGAAVLAHGFMRERSRARELAEALAGAGVVAVAPDLPHDADAMANGDALAELVQDLERGAVGLPPTPRSRIVLIGTSAGGLASVIAAARLPGLAGWIGLDPVDQGGAGVDAARRLEAPAVVLLADASVCNLFGSGRTIARAAPKLVRSERVRGASHCDFEGPTNNFCRAVCGRSARGMAQTVRSEAVGAALQMLERTDVEAPFAPEPRGSLSSDRAAARRGGSAAGSPEARIGHAVHARRRRAIPSTMSRSSIAP
jgi:dienelactone hydrolase